MRRQSEPIPFVTKDDNTLVISVIAFVTKDVLSCVTKQDAVLAIEGSSLVRSDDHVYNNAEIEANCSMFIFVPRGPA